MAPPVLTPAQVAQTAASYANQTFVVPNATATMGSDTISNAVSTIDVNITVSPTALNAAITISCTIVGAYTIVQAQRLVAYTLLKRIGEM